MGYSKPSKPTCKHKHTETRTHTHLYTYKLDSAAAADCRGFGTGDRWWPLTGLVQKSHCYLNISRLGMLFVFNHDCVSPHHSLISVNTSLIPTGPLSKATDQHSGKGFMFGFGNQGSVCMSVCVCYVVCWAAPPGSAWVNICVSFRLRFFYSCTEWGYNILYVSRGSSVNQEINSVWCSENKPSVTQTWKNLVDEHKWTG